MKSFYVNFDKKWYYQMHDCFNIMPSFYYRKIWQWDLITVVSLKKKIFSVHQRKKVLIKNANGNKEQQVLSISIQKRVTQWIFSVKRNIKSSIIQKDTTRKVLWVHIGLTNKRENGDG